MTDASYKAALQICNTHAERLRWALATLQPKRPLTPAKTAALSPLELAVCDQFIVRFAKLQDAMGAKLFPAVLDLTGEHGELAAFIDKLNRLEKIGAIPSAEQWLELREMRNQFAHDYPEDPEIQTALLNKALAKAEDLLQILESVTHFANKYLPTQP